MSMKLNRGAFQQLIDENITWLLEQPRSLERDHIESILAASVDMYYPKEKQYTLERATEKVLYKILKHPDLMLERTDFIGVADVYEPQDIELVKKLLK